MTDTLLRSLRERLLDESEPLAGLLRKCLLLGAETGSASLRNWARKELNGYGDTDETPKYRKVYGMPISVDSTSGSRWVKGQILDRHQLPRETWQYVPDEFSFKEPIEELEQLSREKQLHFTTPGLAYAQSVWNTKVGPFRSIVNMSYFMSGTVLAGILGQIRTNLVDLVADLTAETPLSELPKKGQVDAAVSHHIGDIYNTTLQATSGPVAIGAEAKASTKGLTVEDALRLLDKVQQAAAEVREDQRAELLTALAELRDAVRSDAPDSGDVVRKAGKLRAAAAALGIASVSAAATGAAQTLAELAINGAFG